MMELHDLGDPRGRKNLVIDQFTSDRKEHWNVNLQTSDFPAFFENTNPSNRQVTLKVINRSDWNPSDSPNSFLIPLTLTGVSRVDDRTICYYQQTYDTKNGIFFSLIAASIQLADGQTNPVENPHLLMEFSASEQDNSNRLEGDPQRFAGSPSQGEPVSYVNTLAGENANGGLDIPLDQMDRNFQDGDRVVNA